MIVGANIFVMLLVEAKFKTFTPKAICDVTKNTEVLNCLSCDSREAVDNFPDDIKEAAKDFVQMSASNKCSSDTRYKRLLKNSRTMQYLT